MMYTPTLPRNTYDFETIGTEQFYKTITPLKSNMNSL
jgi:hypothetical protein